MPDARVLRRARTDVQADREEGLHEIEEAVWYHFEVRWTLGWGRTGEVAAAGHGTCSMSKRAFENGRMNRIYE